MNVVSDLAESPYRDALCALFVAILARVWVKAFEYLASSGLMNQNLSRKIVHITSGPFFVLSWPLFSSLDNARIFAAAVPFLNLVRLYLAGSGLNQDENLVKSVSRRGGREELLQGPLYYCLVMVAATLLFWRSSGAGVAAITLMCGGDGMADIVGRNWGSVKLPYNQDKSIAGSVAMLVFGSSLCLSVLVFFGYLGLLPSYPLSVVVPAVVALSLAATVVESLPLGLDDNLSVPAVAALACFFLLPSSV